MQGRRWRSLSMTTRRSDFFLLTDVQRSIFVLNIVQENQRIAVINLPKIIFPFRQSQLQNTNAHFRAFASSVLLFRVFFLFFPWDSLQFFPQGLYLMLFPHHSSWKEEKAQLNPNTEVHILLRLLFFVYCHRTVTCNFNLERHNIIRINMVEK